MGFFSKWSSRNKDVELIARGYAYSVSAIRTYEALGSYEYLEIAIWIVKNAIAKPALEQGIAANLQYPIYIQQNNSVVKLSYGDILDRTWNRISILLEELEEIDENEYYRAVEVASMGNAYFEVQANLPPAIRAAFPDLAW